MRVLRCLRVRRMTSAEVSKAIKIRRSSAHSHLTKLAKAGFVIRHDEGRRWVYYSLTTHGRHLADSERPRIVILFAASLTAAAVSGAYVGASAARWFRPEPPGSWGMDPINLYHQPTFFTPAVAAALVLLGLALGGVIAMAWRLRR